MAVRRPQGARRAPVNPPVGRKSRPQGGVLRATQETAPAGRKSRPQGGVLRATQDLRRDGRPGRRVNKSFCDWWLYIRYTSKNLLSGSTCDAMKRALFFTLILMAKHGIGAGNKRKSHQTGSPCPVCDGSFTVTVSKTIFLVHHSGTHYFVNLD